MIKPYLVLAAILFAGMYGSVRARKLTLPAAIVGGFLGLAVFSGAGFTGIAEIAAFFITGTLATGVRKKEKIMLHIAEDNAGRRTASQVFANVGTAAICGLLAWHFPDAKLLFQVMVAGSIASAAGDTLSSELGNVYGKKYFNILTLRPDQRGLNGVVSLEGTLAGLAGSILIALIFSIGTGHFNLLPAIALGGLLGNLVDSVLGATVERHRILSNDTVNFINTFSGAAVAAVIVLAGGF